MQIRRLAPFWLLLGALMLALFGRTALAQTAVLQDVTFATLPNKKVEVEMHFDGTPPEPKAYLIETPPRLVIDLWGASNGMAQKQLTVRSGEVDSLHFAEANGRMRVVANLNAAAGYDIRAEGNSLLLQLGGATATLPNTVKAEVTRSAPAATAQTEGTRIEGINFHRLEGNVGRITIDMTDVGAGLDIVEEGGNVVVNLIGANLDAGTHQRMDVQDFGTPVNFIDTLVKGRNATVLIRPALSVPYDYMAYQSGSQLVLDFKPLTPAEQQAQADLFPYDGEKIDLNFQNVEIRTVLQIIAEVAEKNLVVSDNVQGTITLRLKNVPWDQALDIVLKTKGLDKREAGNVLLVGTVQEIAEREAVELQSQQNETTVAPLVTDFIQIDYRKASEIKDRLEEAKLVSERGFVMADDETNTLMVRETARQIEQIRKTIKIFDVEVPQIMVQARLVTATNKAAKELGVRWGAGYKGDKYVIGGSPSLNGPVIDPRFAPFTGGPDPVAPLNNPVTGVPYTAEERTAISEVLKYEKDLAEFNAEGQYADSMTIPGNLLVDMGLAAATSGISLGFVDGGFLLSAELLAMQSDGKLEIVSQPKVITTNGKPAVIKAGQEVPFQSRDDVGIKIEWKEVVLKLDVTPQIIPGDKVLLDLVITKDSVGEVYDQVYGNRLINKQELRTSIVVEDGETVVLGGVLESAVSEEVNKTPLLGDLPIIGNLFKNRISTNDKQELLIFITPQMIRESLRQY